MSPLEYDGQRWGSSVGRRLEGWSSGGRPEANRPLATGLLRPPLHEVDQGVAYGRPESGAMCACVCVCVEFRSEMWPQCADFGEHWCCKLGRKGSGPLQSASCQNSVPEAPCVVEIKWCRSGKIMGAPLGDFGPIFPTRRLRVSSQAGPQTCPRPGMGLNRDVYSVFNTHMSTRRVRPRRRHRLRSQDAGEPTRYGRFGRNCGIGVASQAFKVERSVSRGRARSFIFERSGALVPPHMPPPISGTIVEG